MFEELSWNDSPAEVDKILQAHLSTSAQSLDSFIVQTILTTFLRPLFSKSRPATVTASGRKAEFVEPSQYHASSGPEEEETKPWKYSQRHAIVLFEWAVAQSDEELLSKHWHIFTPVVLTLLDEGSDVDIKIRALNVFSAFWQRCPVGLMRKVGLADVFEQAIFPSVLYLPDLTPEEDSVRILNAAYPALFQIAGLSYPEESIGEPVSQANFSVAEKELLDKIVREGIFVGFHHAGEHIRLVQLFCVKLQFAVNGMGILAVKHLKDIIPMISQIMTEPFGTKYPPSLLAATKLLQSILRCCWPRIPFYVDEIIKILTMCWLNIEDEDDWPQGPISKTILRAELTTAASMLSAIIKTEGLKIADKVAPLIQKQNPLQNLFFTDEVPN